MNTVRSCLSCIGENGKITSIKEAKAMRFVSTEQLHDMMDCSEEQTETVLKEECL